MTQLCLFAGTNDRLSWTLPVSCSSALTLGALLVGCGGGGAATASVLPPFITQQPAAQSVPMGRRATYSVTASGTSLQYQWLRDGTVIADAASSTYTTPTTVFDDSGATYTAIVSNSGGSIASAPASLTVTARAPLEGDLRFQQVDADSTINGYGNAGSGLSTDLLGNTAFSFSPAVGTGFWVGSGDCVTPPVTDGLGCSWQFSEWTLVNSQVAAAYSGGVYSEFAQDLQGAYGWPHVGPGFSPNTTHAVITSLDLEPASALFAIAWVQDPTQDGFAAVQQTVAPSDLATAAAAEGAAGRVITALSNNAGQITYFAYSWAFDTTTVYETQIASGSPAAAPGLAAALASAGYIITATGLADDAGT